MLLVVYFDKMFAMISSYIYLTAWMFSLESFLVQSLKKSRCGSKICVVLWFLALVSVSCLGCMV